MPCITRGWHHTSAAGTAFHSQACLQALEGSQIPSTSAKIHFVFVTPSIALDSRRYKPLYTFLTCLQARESELVLDYSAIALQSLAPVEICTQQSLDIRIRHHMTTTAQNSAFSHSPVSFCRAPRPQTGPLTHLTGFTNDRWHWPVSSIVRIGMHVPSLFVGKLTLSK